MQGSGVGGHVAVGRSSCCCGSLTFAQDKTLPLYFPASTNLAITWAGVCGKNQRQERTRRLEIRREAERKRKETEEAEAEARRAEAEARARMQVL